MTKEADGFVRAFCAERDRLLLPAVRWIQRQIERSPRLDRWLSR